MAAYPLASTVPLASWSHSHAPTMHPKSSLLFFLMIGALLTNAMANHAPAPAAVNCVPREREALLAFKRGITGDSAGRLASWKEDDHDCCRWRGVRCSDNLIGHVLELHLQSNLTGVVYVDYSPLEFNAVALVGRITSSLLSLEHLEHLDLSNNNLTGPDGRFPVFVASLRNLQYLDLSGLGFTGMVPYQLGNLSKLEFLDLSGTGMQSADISWLTRLQWLKYLYLSSVNLSAISDWAHVVNKIPSLTVLSLSGCSLTRVDHSLKHVNLTRLEKLHLSGNDFSHPLSSCWFWILKTLIYLDLESTGLYGRFPNAITNMTSLQVLDFSRNNNAGILEPILLRNLCNLESLNLQLGLLSGNMTELLESLSHCSPNKLRKLYLSNNNITGTLPAQSMGQFTSLANIGFSFNQLTGHVPPEIGKLASLTHLDLSENKLTGTITDEHFGGLVSLTYIDLSYNKLKIVIDPEWLPPFRLETAYFASCQMGPLFPAWLRWSSDIDMIDISSANIIDEFPDWVSTAFSKAIYLDMSNNKISGNLPKNMKIMSLEELYLNSNRITGEVPTLPTNLTYLDISNNILSGLVASNFGAPRLDTMNLSSNSIQGQIPSSICRLKYLSTLDLSNNLLNGKLPRCIGMRNLQKLLLSNNNLSGTFPSLLQGCTLLRYIDLSWNRFYGRLPSWIGDFQELVSLQLRNNTFSW